MTEKVAEARIDGFKPTNSGTTPDYQIPGDDILALSSSERAQELIDSGRLTLENGAFSYTGTLTSGDRLRFLTRRPGENSLNHRWTALARTVEHRQVGPTIGEVEVTADDWVFGVLDTRDVTDAFETAQISGANDAILDTILDDRAPEIDTSAVEAFTEDMSITWSGASLLDAVNELAERVNAVVYADDTTLGFVALDGKSAKFGIGDADVGLPVVRENDDKLANVVRVNGGQGVEPFSTQETQDGYTTVTNSSRLTTQISHPKAEVARVGAWTNPTGSGESVSVRVQADDGSGNPTNPSSRESDIARRTLAAPFLTSDGFTTFLMPGHKLPDPNPWLIIESDGSTGQDIGIDTSTGEPAYRAHYSYPLDTVASDRGSIDEYGRREATVKRDDLTTRQEAQNHAETVLGHTRVPDREFSAPAESARVHALSPGDVVSVNEPQLNAVGDYLVTEVSREYDGVNLYTDITAQEVDTI